MSGPLAAPPASDRVRREWARRVEAEYRSSAITQQLTLWLTQLGASPDLIRAGLQIAEDELSHAELSHAALSAAGGQMPALNQGTLGLQRGDRDLDAACVDALAEIFCLGETVAVPLFSALRSECTAPEAKACLDKVLRDEVRHRAFGWSGLTWMLTAWPSGGALRQRVSMRLPQWLEQIRHNYSDRGEPEIQAEERAWGLMHSSRYAEILRRTWRREYAPRFSALEIEIPALEKPSSEVGELEL